MNEPKRAVACKHWRWMPGMLCVPVGGGFPVRYRGVICRDMPDGGGVRYLPDLTDPATLGCLLALVRAAWKDEGLAAVVASYDHENGYQWRVIHGHHHGSTFQAMSQKRYSTEAEALVAALEAAA